MELTSLLTTLVTSVIGGVAVVVVQSVLSRRDEADPRLIEAKHRANADYLTSVAALATGERSSGKLAALVDAKCRIVVYGSLEVVEAMSAFERTGAVLNDDPGQRAFLRIVYAMRGPASKTLDRDAAFSAVLFGNQIDK